MLATLTRRMRLLPLILAVFVSACSLVRVAYNQSDNLVYWYANRALDLNDDQAAQVRAGMAQWLKWHRQTQLPLYAEFLQRSETEALGNVSPALACTRRAELEALGRKAADRAVPLMAEVIVSLSSAQLSYLERFLADADEDFRDDYLQADPKERQRATFKFTLKWTEFFYGELNDAQRDQLARDVAAMPINAQVAYDERLRLEGEWLRMMHKLVDGHATQAQAEQAIRAQLLDIFEPAQPARRERLAHWIQAGCELTAATHNRTSAGQRRSVAELFKSWESDARVLVAQL